MEVVLLVAESLSSLSTSDLTFILICRISPFKNTNPGLAPAGLLTCLALTRETVAFPLWGPLLLIVASNAASLTVSGYDSGRLSSCERITTWLPAAPDTCNHQSALSLCSGLQLNSSLSVAARPTRISILSLEV